MSTKTNGTETHFDRMLNVFEHGIGIGPRGCDSLNLFSLLFAENFVHFIPDSLGLALEKSKRERRSLDVDSRILFPDEETLLD